MKFYKYLNENQSIDEFFDIFKKKCQPFIKDARRQLNEGTYYFSGRKRYDNWFISNIRKDRNPTDTPENIHNLLDDAFQKKFGIRLRSNSIFLTFDTSTAESYGDLYVIFPVGKYEMYYNNNIDDLYMDLGFIYDNLKNEYIENNDLSGFEYRTIKDSHFKRFRDIKKRFPDYYNHIMKEMYKYIENELVNDYEKGLPKYTIDSEIMLYGKKYLALLYDVLMIDDNWKKLNKIIWG